jgi:S-DNA-T family DNA segregation ATPase FtsK/SpoIIIE
LLAGLPDVVGAMSFPTSLPETKAGDEGPRGSSKPPRETGPSAPPPASFVWCPPTLAKGLAALQVPQSKADPALLRAQLEDTERRVKDFLPSHHIKARLGQATVTPNAWRVRIEGQIGVNPADIERLRDQFKTVKGLDLIRAEAEAGYIALSFKRAERGTVFYLDCLPDRQTNGPDFNNSIILGRREDTGAVLYYDIAGADTHALIGGMSNSGKTQLLRTMVLDLMVSNSPRFLKLVLIDPKKVEFMGFAGAPHLAGVPVVTDMANAIQLLGSLVAEMEKRYGLFAGEHVNDLRKYNSLPGVQPIARLVIVFDEFADWMLDDGFKTAVNGSFQRLAGKARAAGIHLILSTQRPDNTVVSPILRANLGAKIALRVDKRANSEIILDEPGAEHLLGYGQGLARLGGERHLFQAAYTPDDTLEAVMNLVRSSPWA